MEGREEARDVGPYTRVGRVAGSGNCAWARTILWFNASEKEGYADCQRG